MSFEQDPAPRGDERFRGKLGSSALNSLGITTGRETHFIFTPDNRRLAVQVSGHEGEKTALLFHGMPGGRLRPSLESSMSQHMGWQIVTYDRPGYGFSDPHPGRRAIDAVDDVKRIADHLQTRIDYGLGWSGGSIFALACAAKSTVQKAVVLAPFGPRGLMGDRQWFDGMAPFNVAAFQVATENPAELDAILERERAKILGLRPDDGEFDPGFSAEDRKVMQLSKIKAWISRASRAALRPGIEGWRDDVVGMSDWGFDPRSIEIPTLIWGAGADIFAPPQHYRWLADNIPPAELQEEVSAPHSRAMELLPSALDWCVGGEYIPPAPTY